MDIVTAFYVDVLKRLLFAGKVAVTDSVLVVCGGPLDSKALDLAGFTDVTITNLDGAMANLRQDAENLTYEAGQFDLVLVHAGLHHCYSPHRALLEMYRVARKCALVFEARDSLLMRAAVKLGLTQAYETTSITEGRGGVADSGIPNFIYRWTEREVEKTISSFDPSNRADILFFYEMRLPIERFAKSGMAVMRLIAGILEPSARLVKWIAPKQCNEFAFAIIKIRSSE